MAQALEVLASSLEQRAPPAEAKRARERQLAVLAGFAERADATEGDRARYQKALAAGR
jgi:hypothetical protein